MCWRPSRPTAPSAGSGNSAIRAARVTPWRRGDAGAGGAGEGLTLGSRDAEQGSFGDASEPPVKTVSPNATHEILRDKDVFGLHYQSPWLASDHSFSG